MKPIAQRIISESFGARVGEPVEIHVGEPARGIAGATMVKKTADAILQVAVPGDLNFFGRHVRHHEALHAKLTPDTYWRRLIKSVKTAGLVGAEGDVDTLQALEDSRIHIASGFQAKLWPIQSMRDQVAVAANDMRIARKILPKVREKYSADPESISPDRFRSMSAHCLRSWALCYPVKEALERKQYLGVSVGKIRRTERAAERAMIKAQELFQLVATVGIPENSPAYNLAQNQAYRVWSKLTSNLVKMERL